MLSEKFVRFQLNLFKPFVSTCSLQVAREGQDKLGQLLTSIHKNRVTIKDVNIAGCDSAMITPKDDVFDGVVLYLHGGGYTCGDIKYAKGFATTLAAKCGIKVFCSAYRLAPEAVFPAAVDDALASYKYLLELGYLPSEIVLCGESAGGGLIFSLCLKLKELGYSLPAGNISISPWTDLTLSGKSYIEKKDVDPSMTKERLKYYADCYVHGTTTGIDDIEKDRKLKMQPLVSPLFGDLTGLPPTINFVGEDEILLDDTKMMHDALIKAGCSSKMIIKKGMWHGYVLYCLDENEDDFEAITQFLKSSLNGQKKLRWMRLDNAAKIYPAVKTRQWNNFFRLSMTLNEPVDKAVLQSALDVTVRRFPSIAVRLRRGMFWYYLEEIPKAPSVLDEGEYPLMRIPFDDIRKCAFRVILYNNRISAEFFHAITDGNGGLIFIKTLVAEYLSQKHKTVTIPSTDGIVNRLEKPLDSELEDSFLKHSGKINASRSETDAFCFNGTPESDGFCTNITFMMQAKQIHDGAQKYNVSVTAFLTAALIKATLDIQKERVENPLKRKDVKVLLPVNLRKIFPSNSLRNFVLYIIAGVDARLGDYSFAELCNIVNHQMGLELTEKEMQKRIAVNVNTEKVALLKATPLFLKNIVMKAVFNAVGEKKSCFSFSNLGIVNLPDEMKEFVSQMDFVLGVQSHAPYNIGTLTYNDTLYMNFIRNIKEPILEKKFYDVLRELEIGVKVKSNQRD